MRREASQHGWMINYKDGERPDYVKRPSKATNASKNSSRCKTARCKGCHDAPVSKSSLKAKGQRKNRAMDIVSNHELFEWSITGGAGTPARSLPSTAWADAAPVPKVAVRRRRQDLDEGFDEEECARAIAESLAMAAAAEECRDDSDDVLEDEGFYRALVDASEEEAPEGDESTDDEAFDSWKEQQEVTPPPPPQELVNLSASSSDEADEAEEGDDAESTGSGWSLCEEEFEEIDEATLFVDEDWAMV